LANEAGVNIEYASGSEFVEIYVGMGAKRIRELFQKARANAPSIIYIDEIDALGYNRSEHSTTGGLREMDMTLNQVLSSLAPCRNGWL
jgi:ATP-dependent Zn protease